MAKAKEEITKTVDAVEPKEPAASEKGREAPAKAKAAEKSESEVIEGEIIFHTQKVAHDLVIQLNSIHGTEHILDKKAAEEVIDASLRIEEAAAVFAKHFPQAV